MGREMARAVNGTPVETLALPASTPRPLPFHAVARHVAPGYLAWLRRKDMQDIQ
jgi:hypothetical protein